MLLLLLHNLTVVFCQRLIQEEREEKLKKDKIEIALEKLKEARIQKVQVATSGL